MKNIKEIEYEICGIYKIKNLINGKFYIGSSIDVRKRLISHLKQLRVNKHYNKYLQNAWNKYGKDAFFIEILSKVEKNILFEEEDKWIQSSKCYESEVGYNLQPHAVGARDREISSETRKKISDSKKELYKDKTKNPSFGSKHTEEYKQKMSNFAKNRHAEQNGTEACADCNRRISQSLKSFYSSNDCHPWIGRSHNDGTKMKMRLAKAKHIYRCIETGEIFFGLESGTKATGVSEGSIRASLNGKPARTRKFNFIYLTEEEKQEASFKEFIKQKLRG